MYNFLCNTFINLNKSFFSIASAPGVVLVCPGLWAGAPGALVRRGAGGLGWGAASGAGADTACCPR